MISLLLSLGTLSTLEIAVKTVGALVLFFGSTVIIYTVSLLYRWLPWSKYQMVVGVAFGVFLCYLGYVSLRFRQRDTGHIIYEHDIIE